MSACPEVAIKRQPTGSNMARAVAAYTMLRAFPHPNLLRMHDCFVKTDERVSASLYIVTDLMSSSLWDIFRSPMGRAGLVPMGRTAGYLAGIAAGLGHVHAHWGGPR